MYYQYHVYTELDLHHHITLIDKTQLINNSRKERVR